jgi:hypothetical protein
VTSCEWRCMNDELFLMSALVDGGGDTLDVTLTLDMTY